jgi:D-3-phosphoglycerate dehydrogenase
LLGETLGAGGVNIANFTLGREAAGGEAIGLLYLDAPAPAPVLDQLLQTGSFRQVKALAFADTI